MKKSVNKYWKKLMKTLIWGDWYKYCEPIHLLKKYYGERFAFYFLFFSTYQSWLFYPSFFGLVLFCYQIYLYTQDKVTLHDAIGNPWIGVYGIFLCLWAHLFVLSWKSK